MSMAQSITEAGGAQPPATVRVWDPFVRTFHWSTAGLFVLAYATGDRIEWLHLLAGYSVAVLVALRTAWGLIGPRHARFSDFVRGPRAVRAYLSDMTRLRARRHLGHNPAGGAMAVALLAMLASIAVTGHLMTTDAFWGVQWIEDLHEFLADATIGLIAVHVLGVVFASLAHRENLVQAMFTGRKPIAPGPRR
ncbi:MAG: cytochrome b/b6 domain-containing protein [Alphaproteobacteria bacterium]|nr:cytochrome b/b6 domain-containing protein [Alphaproteobacteria bacterium]